MPRRSKQSVPSIDTPEKVVEQGKWWCANDATWFGFCNVSLDEADKAEFENWVVEHRNEVPTMLDDLLGEGMKYGLAYDRENQCYIATFTGSLIPNSNVRACMTTRAGTWQDVEALAVWKHFILLKEDYGSLLASGRKRNWG